MTLLLFFCIYFAMTFVLRSWLYFRKTGVNPLVLPRDDDAYGYVGRAFKVTLAALWVFLFCNAIWPDTVRSYGGILNWPTSLQLLGWLLLVASLLWVWFAQSQMGTSWRIGIDIQNETPLVTGGLFSVSRNPIYLSLRVSLLGLCLVLPHTVTACIALIGEVLMQIQVRLEEKHLQHLHGPLYAQYCASVRRWI